MSLPDLVPARPMTPVVHGLKRLRPKQIKRLPFGLAADQVGWSCLCGSWLSFSADEPTEAYRQHVHGG